MVTLGAFVLTYKRPKGLQESLDFLLRQTRRPEHIWVIDNADDPEAAEAVARYRDDGVRYHANSENLGAAGGIATGFELLASVGCDWILSIDDDDAPTAPEASSYAEHLVDLIERNSSDKKLGVVGVSGARFDWQTGEHTRIRDDELQGDLEIDIVGGNALLTISRELLREIGPPNKDFFFGHDDVVFCLEARRHGYQVMVDGEIMHRVRELENRLDLTPVRRTRRATGPHQLLWRKYYVTRNYIYAMHHTFGEPRLARRQAAKSVAQSVFAFGRGPRYGSRFAAMQLRGIVDGYRGRLGRTVQPVAKPTAA